MQTYKEVVAKFKEKNSKTPKTTWRYESWGDSYEQGGRVGYQEAGVVARKSPIKINEETFKKIDNFIAKSEGTLSKKALGESLGYKIVEKGKTAGQGGLNKVIKAWEESRGKTFEFKPSKFTADSPKVKQVIDLFENGMTKSAIEFKTGISRKEIRNIFHQFAPEYIGDVNLPTGEGKNAVKNRRKKIIKELTGYWKDKPGGKKILEEMNQKLRGIKLKNAEIANMSDEAILKNKMFEEAMNLDVKGLKAGEGINFNRYANLTDAEYVAKVRGLAATNQFYQPEHFIAINKKNPTSMLPKNIYTAVGKMGGQMEVLKDHIKNKKKYSSDVVKFLESQNIPITKTPGPIKKILSGAKKVAGKVITGALGPTGIVGLNVGLGADPKNTADRIGIEAEAALAPELVKASIGATKGMKNRSAQKFVQQLLNLGMKTPLALKVARVASPLGLVALGAEGAKFAYDDYQRRKEFITPETITKAQQEQFDANQPMFNEGGRVGLAKGSKGPKDPSRRTFIKGVSALAMLPIVGKYFKLAKPAAKAVGQYTGPVIEKIKGLEWVQFLAKRLWDEGADVTETAARQEREIVRRGTLESGDDVDMVYNLDSGDVRFEVSPVKGSNQTSGGAYNDPYSLDYKAPQVIDEGKQAGTKIKSQIEVAESTPRQVSPDDVELDGDYASVDDAISDLTELEAFAKKKLTKEIHKTKGTKPKNVTPEYDPPDYPEPDLDDFASGGRVNYDTYLPDIDKLD